MGPAGPNVSPPPSGCAQQSVSSGVDTWTGQHSEGGGAWVVVVLGSGGPGGLIPSAGSVRIVSGAAAGKH